MGRDTTCEGNNQLPCLLLLGSLELRVLKEIKKMKNMDKINSSVIHMLSCFELFVYSFLNVFCTVMFPKAVLTETESGKLEFPYVWYNAGTPSALMMISTEGPEVNDFPFK